MAERVRNCMNNDNASFHLKSKVLRVDHYYLELQEGLLYFKDQLFTGYAYEFDDDGVLISQQVIDQGLLINSEIDYLSEMSCERVDFDYLEIIETLELIDETYKFQGSLFSGICYQFDEIGLLNREQLAWSKETTVVCKKMRNWYANGQLKQDYHLGEYKITWNENGSPLSIDIDRNSQMCLYVNYNDSKGRLTWFHCNDLSEFEKQKKFIHFKLSPEVKISGSASSKDFLHTYFKEEQLLDVVELTFGSSLLSISDVLSLNLSKLSTLKLVNNQNITEEDSRKVKQVYPSCEVIWEPCED